MPALAYPSIAVLKSNRSDVTSCMHTYIDPGSGCAWARVGRAAASARNCRRLADVMDTSPWCGGNLARERDIKHAGDIKQQNKENQTPIKICTARKRPSDVRKSSRQQRHPPLHRCGVPQGDSFSRCDFRGPHRVDFGCSMFE